MSKVIGFMGIDTGGINWLGDKTIAIYCVIFTEIWKWSGFCMAIFIAGLQSISKDFYESARIDGASSFRQFLHITIPMLAPSFNIVITLNIIGGLKVFDAVYVLTNGGPGFATQVLSTYVFTLYTQGMLGRSTAMGLLLFIVVSVISLTTSRLVEKKVVET